MSRLSSALYSSAEHIRLFTATLSYKSFYRAHLGSWLMETIRRKTGREGGELRILDLGCGDGELGIAVAKDLSRAFSVTLYAVDPSLALVEALAGRVESAIEGFRLAAPRRVGFREIVGEGEVYDCVVCSHSLYRPLEEVKDPITAADQVWAGIRHLLAPDGVFCFILASRDSFAYVSKARSYELIGMQKEEFSYAERLGGALDRAGVIYRQEVVDTYMDTSSFGGATEARREQALDWLSFFLRVDCKKLDAGLQRALLAIYRQASIPYRCLPQAERVWCAKYSAEATPISEDSLILFHKERLFLG